MGGAAHVVNRAPSAREAAGRCGDPAGRDSPHRDLGGPTFQNAMTVS